jgi:hypothetical protein
MFCDSFNSTRYCGSSFVVTITEVLFKILVIGLIIVGVIIAGIVLAGFYLYNLVLKKDQKNGKVTTGVVQRILTFQNNNLHIPQL